MPYFVASKLQAFNDRGIKNDIRYSQDLEDLSLLLDGCTSFESEIKNSSDEVKKYVIKNFLKWLDEEEIYSEAIGSFLAYQITSPRVERIMAILKRLVS